MLVCLASKGALGKRTHFQHKNVAQLVLQVERKEQQATVSREDSPSYTPPSMLPKVSAAAAAAALRACAEGELIPEPV